VDKLNIFPTQTLLMESLSHDTPILILSSVDEQLITAYGAMKRLGWQPTYAGPHRLIGFTPKKVLTGSEEIMIEAAEDSITFSSKANFDNATWNTTRKDKKNVKTIEEAYVQTQQHLTSEKQERWQQALVELRAYTNTVVAEQKTLDDELERVMHISTGSRYVTIGLLAINILYFVVMAISGVGIFEPSSQGLIDWGANFAPYTLGGEWWRLFTSMFMHIGVIHLVFNMYALFMIGAYIEPMLGFRTFTIAYLCTGIAATLVSISWHDSNMVGAGASGAIFGMYGVFLALLSTNLIPAKARKEMLTGIGVMVAYNLLYGLKEGVDNAAHVGGLVSGLVVGYLLFLGIKKPALNTGIVLVLLATTSLGTVSFLKSQRNDTLDFETTLKRFYTLQDQAMAPFGLEEGKRVAAIKTSSLTAWQNAKKEMEAAKAYKLDKRQQELSILLNEYAALRIQETALIIQVAEGDSTKEADLEKIKLATAAKVEAINKF
jgi:rhomboid protease GluP